MLGFLFSVRRRICSRTVADPSDFANSKCIASLLSGSASDERAARYGPRSPLGSSDCNPATLCGRFINTSLADASGLRPPLPDARPGPWSVACTRRTDLGQLREGPDLPNRPNADPEQGRRPERRPGGTAAAKLAAMPEAAGPHEPAWRFSGILSGYVSGRGGLACPGRADSTGIYNGAATWRSRNLATQARACRAGVIFNGAATGVAETALAARRNTGTVPRCAAAHLGAPFLGQTPPPARAPVSPQACFVPCWCYKDIPYKP